MVIICFLARLIAKICHDDFAIFQLHEGFFHRQPSKRLKPLTFAEERVGRDAPLRLVVGHIVTQNITEWFAAKIIHLHQHKHYRLYF